MKARMAFALLISTMLLVGGCREPEKTGDQTPSPGPEIRPAKAQEGILKIEAEMLRDLKLTTAAAESRPGVEGVMLLGELRVNENSYAEVGSPMPARVVTLAAAAGQRVRAGQALTVLESVELGRARSTLIIARARLEVAQQALERKRRLGAEKIVSEREVQEAEANAVSAEAELRAARAALRALGVAANPDEDSESPQFTLRSPVSGMVIERAAMRGQMVEPAQPLFRVGDLSTLWLTVQAFERDAVRIKAGSPARITFAALPGRTFTGRVALVGGQVNAESRTVPIRIDLANEGGVLRPGMSSTAWVTPAGDATTVVTVPAAALQRVEEDWVVFIPRSPDTFEVRKVGRGRDLAGEIEILSGLKAGETVVVDGSFLLKAEGEKAHGEGEHHEH